MKRYNSLQAKIINQKRMFSIVLAGLFMSHLALTHADASALEQDLDRLERNYTSRCLETNVIERIQLARNPDRRKVKAMECLANKWTKKAFDLIDHSYNIESEQDGLFRQNVNSLARFEKTWDKAVGGQFLKDVEFATKSSKPDSETEPPKLKVDTLKTYTTLSQ